MHVMLKAGCVRFAGKTNPKYFQDTDVGEGGRRDPTFALYEQCITKFSLHERPFMVALLFVVGARR